MHCILHIHISNRTDKHRLGLQFFFPKGDIIIANEKKNHSPVPCTSLTPNKTVVSLDRIFHAACLRARLCITKWAFLRPHVHAYACIPTNRPRGSTARFPQCAPPAKVNTRIMMYVLYLYAALRTRESRRKRRAAAGFVSTLTAYR